LQGEGFFGWSLGLASGVFRAFPDFLFRLEPDMPFYLAYFLTGWWLHRQRDSLPDVARVWLPSLLVGVLAHTAATSLSATYARQTGLPQYDLIRLSGYSLYAVGSAYTAFGFLGFFQRYIDRATRIGRYLADTAFWVYLVHQPLLAPLLSWFAPIGLPWWLQGLLVAALATAAALLLYEAIVRPTPLIGLFGPTAQSRAARDHSRKFPRQDEEALKGSGH
jgi:glucan biosynthesis protein C